MFSQDKENGGFSEKDISAFKTFCVKKKVALISRGVNPLCANLLWEGYAAKGFHIKAKTCDWGPMAGFIPLDYRFTKKGQLISKQKKAIITYLNKYINIKTIFMPLYLSEKRVQFLLSERYIDSSISYETFHIHRAIDITCFGNENYMFKFRIIKDSGLYKVVYSDVANIPDEVKFFMYRENLTFGAETPFFVLTNPINKFENQSLTYLEAATGDYDIWGIFPHISSKIEGLNDRPMRQRALISERASALIKQKAQQAGVIYGNQEEINSESARFENPDLGNMSFAFFKLTKELNELIRPGKPVIMHSDYCGNPYGEIDYPLVCFIPFIGHDSFCDFIIINDLQSLRAMLVRLNAKGFKITLNPNWAIKLF